MNETYLIDTHSHINTIEKTSVEEVLQNAIENNVKKVIVPATSVEDIDEVYNLAQKYENVFCYLGVHPEEVKTWNDDVLDKIREYSKSPKVLGIGEIGLDYYWDKTQIDLQKEIFIKQIQLANELNLPINIHDREAHQDTFEIVKKYNKTSQIIMHCFSGSPEFALECVKEGWYVALGGVLTFKKAKKVKDVGAVVPLDRILFETDAPFMTPEPYRGRENQPAYVKYVAEELARIRGISYEEVVEAVYNNTVKLFPRIAE